MGILPYPGYISSCVRNASSLADLSRACVGESLGVSTIAVQILSRAVDTRFRFQFIQLPEPPVNVSSWRHTADALQEGYFDMTMDIWTVTFERAKAAQFSTPVLFKKRVFLMNKENLDSRSLITYGGLEWLTVTTMVIGILLLLSASLVGWFCDRLSGYRAPVFTMVETLLWGDALVYYRNSRQTAFLTVLIALLGLICHCSFSATAKSNLQPISIAPIRSLSQLAWRLSNGRNRIVDYENHASPLERMIKHVINLFNNTIKIR